MSEPDNVVVSYRTHYRLSRGDRQQRLMAADDHFWAVEAVMEAVESRDPDLLGLLDRLIEVPDADSAYLAYVAAGPVEDMLNQDPMRWDVPLADRCRLSPRWREVLHGVDLGFEQHAALRALVPYLRPLPTTAGRCRFSSRGTVKTVGAVPPSTRSGPAGPYRRPMKRLVPTPRGMAELDIAGSERHVFVTVTRFDEEGWATEEEMWASHHAESLPLLVSRLTEMPTAEADAVVANLMATWRVKGGAAEGAALTRRFGLGIVGVLLAVALVAVLLFWAVVAVLN